MVKKPTLKKPVAKKPTAPKRRHVKETYRQDWDLLTVHMPPEVLTKALKFSEENNIVLSQLMTSAVKVFMSEAEEYIAEQLRLKRQFFHSSETFRVSKAYTTADAVKDQNLSREQTRDIKETLKRKTAGMNPKGKK